MLEQVPEEARTALAGAVGAALHVAGTKDRTRVYRVLLFLGGWTVSVTTVGYFSRLTGAPEVALAMPLGFSAMGILHKANHVIARLPVSELLYDAAKAAIGRLKGK